MPFLSAPVTARLGRRVGLIADSCGNTGRAGLLAPSARETMLGETRVDHELLAVQSRADLIVLGRIVDELAILIGEFPHDRGGRSHRDHPARNAFPRQHHGTGGYDGVFADASAV